MIYEYAKKDIAQIQFHILVVSLFLPLNRFHKYFWSSIADFKLLIVGWDKTTTGKI